MPQPQVDRNPVEAFFDAFSGQHLFRAVNHASEHAVQLYGEYWLHAPDLERLNADGYSIYFCVNDPHGTSARAASFTGLRCIYQDAEPGKTADPTAEPTICGQPAHMTIQTSEGRFQRFWLMAKGEEIGLSHWPHIQRLMCEWHGHDNECATGPAQIMRAPGFLNTKYDPAPRVLIVADRLHLPKLTLAAVAKYFAFPDPFAANIDPNAANAAQRYQSGDAKTENVYSLDKERARRSGTADRLNAERRQVEALHGTPPGTLPLADILDVMARLNPSMGRNEWRKVGGALHFMFQGSDTGLNIFERWSGLGDNYKGGFDCEGLWNGLDVNVPRPAHWITLKHMASQCRPGAAEQARLRSPAFEALRGELDAYLDVTFLHVGFTFMRGMGDGRAPEPDPTQIQNVRDLLAGIGTTARWDDFTACVRLFADGRAAPLSQEALVDLWATAHDQGLKLSRRALEEFLTAIARQSSYNPAQEYMHKRKGKWDGVSRLERLFIDHLGAPDTPSIRELGVLTLCAAVRRVFEPGYKFDLMPILQGAQGLGKSSLFALLCPDPEWFLNSVRLDLEEKRLYAQIQGKLFVEFGELSGKKNAEVEKIKAFVTQQTDEYIANYASATTRRERASVFVGTTNEHRFLRDLTGNRRFPVIPVAKELDWEALRAVKDQLWAEAVAVEDVLPDLRLSPEAVADMEAVQQSRIDRDVTVEEIFRQIDVFKTGFVHRDSLWAALGYDNGRERDKKLAATARFALRDLESMMRHAGWSIQEVSKHSGGAGRGHFRKEKRVLAQEIVYSGARFLYRKDLTDEANDLLD